MITMQEWMNLVDYRITEGSDYGWDCYGNNSYSLSSWNGLSDEDGVSFNIVFSTKNQKVFEVEVCDYKNNRGYRMIHPDHVEKHTQEAEDRGLNANEAWDDIKWINLEVEEDFLEKARAIKEGEDYDTEVSIPLNFSDEELLMYMKAAHVAGLSFNDYTTKAIRTLLNRYDQDPISIKAEVDAYKRQYNKD